MEEEEQERYRCQSNLDRSEYEKKKRNFENQRAVHLKDTVLGASVLESIKHRRNAQTQRESDHHFKEGFDQKLPNTDVHKYKRTTKPRSKSHEH